MPLLIEARCKTVFRETKANNNLRMAKMAKWLNRKKTLMKLLRKEDLRISF